MGANTGLGATAVFTDIALSGLRVRSIGALPLSVDGLDDTALDSLGFYESVPDDLAKVETVEIEVYSDLTKTVPIGTVGTLTITFPKQGVQSVGATISGTGWISKHSLPALGAGNRLITTLTFTFDGKTGPTFTAAT